MPASPGSNESGRRARDDDPPGSTTPALSLVIPCYNEEEVLPQTVSKLARAFDRADIALQLVCVDNGSRDRTRAIIADLERRFPGVVTPVHVEKNIGMGNGVLTGIPTYVGKPVDAPGKADDGR